MITHLMLAFFAVFSFLFPSIAKTQNLESQIVWIPSSLVIENVTPGETRSRAISLQRSEFPAAFPTRQVKVFMTGDLEEFVTIVQPEFPSPILKQGESVTFDILISIPEEIGVDIIEGEFVLKRILPNGKIQEIPDTDSLSVTVTIKDELITFPAGPPIPISEEDKMTMITDDTRPYRYVFNNPVSLYVSDGPGRPENELDSESQFVAIDSQGPEYTNAFHAAFVEKGGDELRWFSYTTIAENVSHVVWQIADREFVAGNGEWRRPQGLIADRWENASSAEFSFDFSQIIDSDSSVSSRISPQQKPYFVRALAIDSQGQIIGESDRGLAVLYGHPIDPFSPENVIQLFPLLTPPVQGDPDQNEVIFNLDDYAEHDCGLPETDPWYFWPENIPANAQSLYLQVSLSPLSSNGWRDPPGLIYERILSKGTEEFDGLFGGDPTFNSVPVDFLDIADYEKEYYVRAVVLSPGSEAGVVVPSYSKTVRFVCRPPGASEFTYYPPVEPELLQPPIPHVKLVKYEPIHWERSDWMYLYEVTRQPTWKEISPIFAGNDELVESYPVGQVITLGKPSSDDGSWLSDAWNAITEFFSSIIDYIADVTDWVSAAYADIKADIIEFAASTLPMPPPADEYLEDALTYMVDYGLISIGIPPELPNFDQLTAQGVDYLAASALDMAGIPETDWTKEKIAQIGSGVASAMNDAAKTGDAPNPLNWNFVRQWPGGLYRPAYLLLRITNPFDTPTESGVVRGRVFRQLNQADLGVTEIMTLYASFCKSMYFELYRPVDDIRIPRLPPNTTIEIPIYLEEYTGAAYTFCPTTVQQNDFHRMYNFFGEVNFSFSINFDLPPAEQYAEENGMINESGFAWARTSAGFGFVGNPYSSYYP